MITVMTMKEKVNDLRRRIIKLKETKRISDNQFLNAMLSLERILQFTDEDASCEQTIEPTVMRHFKTVENVINSAKTKAPE